ncbi:molybdate ABC transporter substrate-binding protein [Photobacterium lutimaris]|uniref:Molybdate ABC transporter substrate-binding protein n=1 Tax=Photobacterium lutimaris TaxID=388278 RepID=A0A2T3J3P1_9GAMM|nr:molybdate ABC transporter substrate-binding protein [Photobacterium lutimaris]PSU35917.1 molybdate ABC transporter substrate-binding protein [Photobacterium lutimaris]TDR78995.1 molybdate transport system substrate-binding protein [Photobacterium lutimaris]
MKCWKGTVAAVAMSVLSFSTIAAEKVTVFAASSLTNAMNEVVSAYERKTGEKPTVSYASSSALARQIAQGAPADIYLSANEKWMDYLLDQGVIQPSTRKPLLRNSLVMVAPKNFPHQQITLSASLDLGGVLDGTRLAVGDPNHVPAGIYTKEALEHIGLWQQAERLLARANNVRGALLLVERQEALLGVVYKTDALISSKVNIVSEFPAESHTAITYPIAMVDGHKNESAKTFYHYLSSKEAADIFTKYGFGDVSTGENK